MKMCVKHKINLAYLQKKCKKKYDITMTYQNYVTRLYGTYFFTLL
jgi:hypothetical protein